MLNHNKIKELLAEYALGDLSGDQAKIVTEHIAQCQSCKQELESMRLVLDCAGQMSKVSVDDDMYVSAKEGLLTSLSPEKRETPPAKTAKIIQWRTIMQNKVTKFATAAVIILGVFLGMYMLGISPDGSSVAWASLAEHVQQVKTVIYSTHMTSQGMPGDPEDKPVEMECVTIISSGYGMKVDTIEDSNGKSSMYLLYADNTMITLMPETKEYMRVILTDDIRKKMKQQSYDPIELVVGFMGVEFTEIGRKEIDGVLAEGVQIKNSKLEGFPFEIITGQLWVDVNTDLPVLVEMEMEMKMPDGVATITGVSDNFKWNVELDENEFAYTIPEDYEEMLSIKMPESNADSSIKGLRMLIDVCVGKFPKTLNMIDLAKDISKYQTEGMLQKLESDNEVDPYDFAKKNTQQISDANMKMLAPCMFYMQLVQEKKDPAYYGDRITPADKDMILMRWLNDKDGYTVIFADLSTGDFTVEQVVEMELELPDPPEPADEVEEVPAISSAK